MVRSYHVSGQPEIETGDAYSTCMTRAKNAIDTLISCFGGDGDPTTGGTWGSDEVGAILFDRTNEVGGGDGLGGAFHVYEQTGATPTYARVNLMLRRIHAVSPTTNILSGTTSQNVAFTGRRPPTAPSP
jgi:hypothetical protein